MSMQRRVPSRESGATAHIVGGTLRFIWHAVRLPIFAFLVILEPVIRFGLAGLALIGVLMAFVLEFSGAAPRFPFWLTIAMSIGCVLTLWVYYLVMRLFSR